MRHILSVLVNNQPRVLARVASLLGQRNFNIESISVGETEDPALSRMIIVTHGDGQMINQVSKQLSKLIDVIEVQDLQRDTTVERELVLVKIKANPAVRAEISSIVEPFRASVVDVNHDSMTIQATGERLKIEALIELLRKYGITEIARTGVTALARGAIREKVTK